MKLENSMLNKITIFIFFASFLFCNCYSFKTGYKKWKAGRYDKSYKIFQKNTDHKVWGEGAAYYLECINLRKNRQKVFYEAMRMDSAFCAIYTQLRATKDIEKIKKLLKYEVDTNKVKARLINLQNSIVARIDSTKNIGQLDSLLEYFPCWQSASDTSVMKKDSLAELVVNALLCDTCEISYADATSIIQNHEFRVRPENYDNFTEVRQAIWRIFMKEEDACQRIDEFKRDHPYNNFAMDCWYDTASHVICSRSLKKMLDFHARHPYSIFDDVMSRNIMAMNALGSDETLNETEKRRIKDIETMYEIRRNLCKKGADMATLQEIDRLSKEYHEHSIMFDIVKKLTNYHIMAEEPEKAKATISKLSPYFTDESTCKQYEFQVGKQGWFNRTAQMLNRSKFSSSKKRIAAMKAWNTLHSDEFNAISWGNGDEVYFVRRKRGASKNEIMSSIYDGKNWSVPSRASYELNFAFDVEPLCINESGQIMLLRSANKIWQATRTDPSAAWTRPEPLPITLASITWATFLPDGNNLLVAGISNPKWSRTDIFLYKLGKLYKLKDPVNFALSNEMRPYVTPDGQYLYMTSDRPGGMGETDVYAVSLCNPPESMLQNAPIRNLGWQFNTSREDFGFTFASTYSGKGFLHRYDLCGEDMDIFQGELPLLPPPCDMDTTEKQTVVFMGIVLDENSKPVPGEKGSFVEFMEDTNVVPAKSLVSKYGTYVYRPMKKVKTLRIFPEIPGYYSENDKTYSLDKFPQDTTIRDTFRIKSFDYIQKNFVLEHGLFIEGIADFENKDRAYPEMVRLAKMARRMGASIEVVGHTDGSGTEENNQVLALKRADTVRGFLVNTCGFDASKITAFGLSSTKPKCPNTTEEGRRCNRRVEIKFKRE